MNELLPPDLRSSLPVLRSQEGLDDPIVYAKFFFPLSGWTWFVTEGQQEGSDFVFFGHVIGFEAEWGAFSLRELEAVNLNGLTIERDEYFESARFSDCLLALRSHGIKPSGGQSNSERSRSR